MVQTTSAGAAAQVGAGGLRDVDERRLLCGFGACRVADVLVLPSFFPSEGVRAGIQPSWRARVRREFGRRISGGVEAFEALGAVLTVVQRRCRCLWKTRRLAVGANADGGDEVVRGSFVSGDDGDRGGGLETIAHGGRRSRSGMVLSSSPPSLPSSPPSSSSPSSPLPVLPPSLPLPLPSLFPFPSHPLPPPGIQRTTLQRARPPPRDLRALRLLWRVYFGEFSDFVMQLAASGLDPGEGEGLGFLCFYFEGEGEKRSGKGGGRDLWA
ncbi:hypothetical protein B0H13DRAFT_2432877 [Mycena leptocephala]|nr:hypothetical protein B0H13DRAFT_2432877 [Mycena leptocephala]